MGRSVLETKIGSVAKCQHDKLAVVTKCVRRWSEKTGMQILHYEGIGFDGKPWISKEPLFIAANLNEYILNKPYKY